MGQVLLLVSSPGFYEALCFAKGQIFRFCHLGAWDPKRASRKVNTAVPEVGFETTGIWILWVISPTPLKHSSILILRREQIFSLGFLFLAEVNRLSTYREVFTKVFPLMLCEHCVMVSWGCLSKQRIMRKLVRGHFSGFLLESWTSGCTVRQDPPGQVFVDCILSEETHI